MTQDYRIPNVPADIIMEVMEGVCLKNGMNVDEATAYIAKSKSYAKRALVMSEQLGMVTSVDSKFEAVSDAKIITRASKDQWPVIFGKFLQRFNPLILFASLLSRGNSLKDSARKIKVIYNIDTSEDVIGNSLVGWGLYAGILKREKDKVELLMDTENLSAEYIRELLQAMENDVRARVYIANKLGEEVFGYIQQDETDLLVQSIREHRTNPKHSIDIGGQALEDFLRRLATDNSVDVTTKTGIQQLADSLIGAKLITIKHLEICKAINSFRIAAGHNKDRTSMEKWTLNPDAAIECILLTLTIIRSTHNYMFKKIQMF